MSEKKKRIREKVGQVFQVPLGDGLFGYGQIADKVTFVFFDHCDDGKKILKSSSLVEKPLLFLLTVDSYVIREQIWPIIDICIVNPDFQKSYDSFSYDYVAESYILWTMRSGTLEQIKVSWEEIKDLECFASWGHGAVEQRLRDHFAGRPNYFYESDRNQHNPNFPGIEEFYKQYGYDFKLPESFEK